MVATIKSSKKDILKPTCKSKVYKKSEEKGEITVATHANLKIVRIPNSEIRGKTKAKTIKRVAAKVAEISNSPTKRSVKFSNPVRINAAKISTEYYTEDENIDDFGSEGYSYSDFYNDYLNIAFLESKDTKSAKFLKKMFEPSSSESDY